MRLLKKREAQSAQYMVHTYHGIILLYYTRPKNNLLCWPFFWLALTAVVIVLDGHISINTSSWVDWRVVYIRHSINPHTNTRKHCNSVFVTLLEFYFWLGLDSGIEIRIRNRCQVPAKNKIPKASQIPNYNVSLYLMPYVNHSPIDPTRSIDGDMTI